MLVLNLEILTQVPSKMYGLRHGSWIKMTAALLWLSIAADCSGWPQLRNRLQQARLQGIGANGRAAGAADVPQMLRGQIAARLLLPHWLCGTAEPSVTTNCPLLTLERPNLHWDAMVHHYACNIRSYLFRGPASAVWPDSKPPHARRAVHSSLTLSDHRSTSTHEPSAPRWQAF